MKGLFVTIGCMIMLSISVGCEQSTTVAGLSNYELAEKFAICAERRSMNQAALQSCREYKTECMRRQSALGMFVCTVD